jgi:hypothetical protein
MKTKQKSRTLSASFRAMPILLSSFGLSALLPHMAAAQGDDPDLDAQAMALEEIVIDVDLKDVLGLSGNDEVESSPLVLFGYVRSNVEKVFQIPDIDASGNTVKADDPIEWSNPNFHLFGGSKINSNLEVEFNLFGAEDEFKVVTAWGNFRYNDLLQVKVGKQYRRFGLFNEKLDHIPVFMGIEPPELFDKDHLLLPRTTTLSLHGEMPFAEGTVSYWLSTDNPESGTAHGTHPLGYDVRYKTDSLLFGLSGYFSSFSDGETQSNVALGSGSPSGGVLPWMAGDKYNVIGGFLETAISGFIVQTGYFQASHEATRDPLSVLQVINEANINPAQRARFLGLNAGKADADLVASDVVTRADYDVETAYFRIGYPLRTDIGSITPYFHWDWMDNPETIRSKSYGGDNESGAADDGEFTKYSVGVVYNPFDGVAIKLDSSVHEQQFNGRKETYPEVRLDFSLTFKM